MKIKPSFSRRKLLQGVSSALLYAPLMRVLRESDAMAAGDARVLFVYYGAGTYGETFWPSGSTCDNLPATTAPLLMHKEDLVIFQGLNMKGQSNHDGSPVACLAGHTKGLAGISTPYSLDQQLGDTMGANSMKKMVALGCLTSRGGGPTRAISFNKAGQGMPAVDNPKAAYDDIFGAMFALDNRGGSNSLALAEENVKSGKKRVLDYVKGDLKRIENALGPVEGKVFQAHVAALDELHEDIKRSEQIGKEMPGNEMPGTPKPDMGMCGKENLGKILPQGNTPNWYHKPPVTPSINRFNRELMMHAFLCNITRVGLMQYAYADCAEEFYFEEGASTGVAYHSNTHANTPGLTAIQGRILKEVSTMVSTMKAAGIWDNTLVVFTTCIGSNPNAHDGTNIPCFMMGKMNGKLKGNRKLTFNGTEHNKFLVTAAHLVGQTQINHVGNTNFTGVLPGVF